MARFNIFQLFILFDLLFVVFYFFFVQRPSKLTLVKIFYSLAVIYVYVFIIFDVLRLNPDDDGRMALLTIFPHTLLILLVSVYLIVFYATPGKYTKTKKVVKFLGALFLLLTLLLIFSNIFAGEIKNILYIFNFLFITWVIKLFIPLVLFMVYVKISNQPGALFLSAFLLFCLMIISYPAKNYILALSSTNPCATKPLILNHYVRPYERQEIYNGVVCINEKRGYPSHTFKWSPLKHSDAKSFEYLGIGYSRDKNHVFYESKIIKADPKTFDVNPSWPTDKMPNFIRGGTAYVRDKNFIYYEGKKLPVSSIIDFKIIDICNSYRCATDGVVVFKDGQIIKDLNPKKIISLHSCEYAKDNLNVYYSTDKIVGADAETFTVYGDNDRCYAHDKLNVYYEGVIIPGANPKKFHRIKKGDWSSPYVDDGGVYYDGKRLDIDVKNYKYLGKSTIKDTSSVYYRDKKIPGADPQTFKLIPHESCSMCAKDKNNEYFDGEIVEPPVCE